MRAPGPRCQANQTIPSDNPRSHRQSKYRSSTDPLCRRFTALAGTRRLDIRFRSLRWRPMARSISPRSPAMHPCTSARYSLRTVRLLNCSIKLRIAQIVFRDHHHARRVFIQTMHDPRPPLTADTGDRRAVVQDRVDQSAASAPRRGVDDHASGFVNNHNIFDLHRVYVQRQVLAINPISRTAGMRISTRSSHFQPHTRLNPPAVDRHVTGINEPLHPGTAHEALPPSARHSGPRRTHPGA